MRRLATALLLSLAALPLHAAITGTLVNADGHAVAGAKVSIFALELPEAALARLTSASPERTPIAATTSDGKGKFSIPSPKEPVVTLSVAAPGIAPISLPTDRDDELGAILLSAAPMKQARITAAGKPVAGATVIVRGRGEFVAVTDAEGKYSAPDPSRWADRIIVRHPDFATINEGPRGPDARSLDLNRTLEPGVAVSGRVVGEDGKAPIAGATLVIDEIALAKSGEDGTFTIPHAPKQWQTIEARNGSLAGDFSRNGNATPVVRLAKTASVTGTLRDMKTLAPVAGAMIQLRQGRRFDFSGSIGAITDAKGAFVVNVPAGNYGLSIARPGYSAAQASVNAPAGAKLTKNLVAMQLARVSGVVVDENRSAVSGTRIEAGSVAREPGMRMFRGNMGEQQYAMAGPDGSFVVRPEPDTDFQIEAKKKGYPDARTPTMRLAPGERKSGVVLTIPAGVGVSGHVIDKDGKPVAGAVVSATEAQTGGSNFVRRVVRFGENRDDDNAVKTAADGKFTMRLKPGTYAIRVKHDGFATRTIAGKQVAAGTPPLEVTLEPGVALAGRITRGGAGLEGVSIDIFGDEDDNENAKTGPDGSFRIEGLTPGQGMMNIVKQEDSVQQFRPVTIPSENLVIDLPIGGRVSGRVVEKGSGNPVTEFDAGYSAARGGAGMMFFGPGVTKHFTSDDGSFVLEHVPPGATNIVVTAAGFTQGRAQNINVEDGKTIADVEVQLDHGVHVTGRVTSPDGSPLGGVSVMAMPAGSRRFPGGAGMGGAVTDASGEYSLENIESGDKSFTFERSGYLTTQKTATISGSDARVDAQLNTGLRITGTVVSDSGVPQPDAFVSASSASDSPFGGRSTRTDANGQFEMADLAPGRYSFSASKAGYASGSLKDVDIAAGAPVRITLQTGGTITGHITGLSADETSRAGVIAQSGSSRATGAVDSGGNYRIDGAPTGTVRVYASVATGIGGRFTPAQSVQLDPGGNVQVDLAFASGTVRGRVTRDGKPAAQAMVMFAPRAGQATTMARTSTDSDGNYEAQGLSDATYDVQVVDLSGGGTPYRTSFDVHGEGTLNIDIKSATVRGRVLDASTGQPIGDAAVQIRGTAEGTLRGPLRTLPSDTSGAFIIDSVPPGTYNVSAEKEGYGTKLVEVNVGDSGADVELKLAPTAGVKLRVVDGRDGRQISALVRVTDMANSVVYESPYRFTAGGADVLSLPLDAGTYRAIVAAQGYATQNVMISSPSTQTVAMTPGGSIAVKSAGSTMRRARLLGPDGREYLRAFSPPFNVDPSPGTTIFDNIAPGTYTLQIMNGDAVTASTQVTVIEGQVAQVSI